MTYSKRTTWCAAALCAAISFSAQAQESDAASGIMEELVVTAQKREEAANDVGISLTAVSGDLLRDIGANTVNDLSNFVPNVTIQNQFGGDMAVFDIRGVALFSYDTANSSPVATYVDGVVLPYPAMTQGQLFDVERVEVLRGPQGTLFGKNTTGGAVSFITKGPGEELGGDFSVDVGDYDYAKIDLAIGGPLSDTFGARIAASVVRQNEGFQTDVVTGQDVGSIDRKSARLTLSWMPTDTFDATLKIRTATDKSENQGLKIVESVVTASGVFDPIFHPGHWDTAVSANVPFFADIQPFDIPQKNNKSSGATLTANLDIGDMTLTSVTGYDKLERQNQMDWDGTPLPINDYSFTSDMDAWSQELRLASNTDSSIGWMLGAYFAGDEVGEKSRWDCSASDICLNLAYGNTYVQEATTNAVFANVDWDVSDTVTLTAGLRYTEEEREMRDLVTTLDADPFFVAEGLLNYTVGPGSLTGHLAPDFSSASGILECLVFGGPDFAGNFINPSLCPAYGVPYNKTFKDDAVSGKLGITWFATDNTMVYGSVSRGFKSGGFGTFPATTTAQWDPYKPETLTAIEAGTKITLADGRAQLNIGAYYYDYEDRQVFSGLHDLVYGPLSAYVNAPKSTLSGAEVELNWAPGDGWEIRQAIGLSGGKFDEFVDYDSVRVLAEGVDPVAGLYLNAYTIDRSGTDAPGTDLQYSGLVAYRFAVASEMDLRFQVDYAYNDGYRSIYGRQYDLGSYSVVNAQIALMESADDRWQLALWGRNLGNEEYFTDKNFYNEGVNMGAVGAPRTYGLRFTYSMN